MSRQLPLPSAIREEDISLGLDIGKTHIAGGLVSRIGECLSLQSVVSTAEAGRDALLQTCYDLVGTLLTISPQRPIGIGIGAPGIVDHEQGVVVKSEVIQGWIDVPLREIFQSKFQLPTIADNDVFVGACGEARFGAARSASSAVYMVIGTGIGAATIYHGEVWHGSHQLAGQIAHLVLPRTGRSLQETFGGRGIEMRAASILKASYSTKDVFQLARTGDVGAVEIVDEAVDCAALTLAWLQQIIDPEVFVLNGGVALSEERFISRLKLRMEDYLKPYIERLPSLTVIGSPLGATGGVLGAASLIFDASKSM